MMSTWAVVGEALKERDHCRCRQVQIVVLAPSILLCSFAVIRENGTEKRLQNRAEHLNTCRNDVVRRPFASVPVQNRGSNRVRNQDSRGLTITILELRKATIYIRWPPLTSHFFHRHDIDDGVCIEHSARLKIFNKTTILTGWVREVTSRIAIEVRPTESLVANLTFDTHQEDTISSTTISIAIHLA